MLSRIERLEQMMPHCEGHRTTIQGDAIGLHAPSTFPESRTVGRSYCMAERYTSMVEDLKTGVLWFKFSVNQKWILTSIMQVLSSSYAACENTDYTQTHTRQIVEGQGICSL